MSEWAWPQKDRIYAHNWYQVVSSSEPKIPKVHWHQHLSRWQANPKSNLIQIVPGRSCVMNQRIILVSCKERICRYPYTIEFWRVSKECRNGTDDDQVSSQVARTWSINIVSYQEYWLRFVHWNSEKFKALYDDNYILRYNLVHLLSTLHPTHLDGTLLTGPEPHTLIVVGNRRINNPSCAPSHIFVTKEIISPVECIVPQH